jgi:MoxR-like ATPase
MIKPATGWSRTASSLPVHLTQQIFRAASANRNGRDHRDTQLRRELLEINLDPPPRRDVEHIEDEHHRLADPLELDHQAQGQPQVGSISHAQQQVGLRLSGQSAKHKIAGDLFVRAAAAQRIGSGQVDQIDAAAGGRLQCPGFALDRHTRVVGHFLVAAGQGIEQRGLAAVRCPDQRQMPRA